ncbi:MAG: hypothetical protein M1836_003712 [Candelina mexicana]|nr:MAG: hypothetical protein M1836_003712 [Candelina mexicana]
MKVFHCVVDDTAFLDGIDKIEKWVSGGAITAFMPLCTLDQLRKLSKGNSESSAKAMQCLRLLSDCATSRYPAGSIKLQLSTERYWYWSEVEKHVLSMYKRNFGLPNGNLNGYARNTGTESTRAEADSSTPSSADGENKRLSSSSSATTTSSNGSTKGLDLSSRGEACKGSQVQEWRRGQDGNVGASGRDRRRGVQSHSRETSGSEIGVPQSEQYLINAVVWQLYKTPKNLFDDKSIVLLTNSPETAKWAQKFGITVKTLSQLAKVISAGQDYKDLLAGSEIIPNRERTPVYEVDSDDEVIVFVPKKHKVLPPIGAERKSKTPSLSSCDGGVPLYPAGERKSQSPLSNAGRHEEIPSSLNLAKARKSQTPSLGVEHIEQISAPLNSKEECKTQSPRDTVDRHAEGSTPVISMDSFSRDLPVKPVNSTAKINGLNGVKSVNGVNGSSRTPTLSEPSYGRLSPPKSPSYAAIAGSSTRPPKGPKLAPRGSPRGNASRRREGPREDLREGDRMAADVDFKLNSGAPRSASHGKKLWQP